MRRGIAGREGLPEEGRPAMTRREFLKDGLSIVLAGALAALGARSLASGAKASSCSRMGYCEGCAGLSSCGLPPALSRRASLGLSEGGKK